MVLEALVEFVFPRRCVGCGLFGTFLCLDCKDRLDFATQICSECGQESVMGWTHEKCKKKDSMDGLIVLYEYEEEVMKKVIEEVKYVFNREILALVLKEIVFEMGESFDYVVPVPLYFYRENWRGFNQAELLAKIVESKNKEIKLKNLLVRTRNTKQQAVLRVVKERLENVEGAFAMKRRVKELNIKGKKVLLVDDVFTSGAHMRECAKVLKRAGARLVWGLALAH